MLMSGVGKGLILFTRIFHLSFQSVYESLLQRLYIKFETKFNHNYLLKKNSQVFRRRLITTDRLPVCEHFGVDKVTLIITSPKRNVTVLIFLSLQICPAVFVRLLAISHLCRRLRTH